MLMVILLNSFWWLPRGMSLASTCSAAISAACHRPPEDDEAHLLPVQWGVIPNTLESNELRSRHCTFTTPRDVQAPVDGQLYLVLLPQPQGENGSRPQRSRRWWSGHERKGYPQASNEETQLNSP